MPGTDRRRVRTRRRAADGGSNPRGRTINQAATTTSGSVASGSPKKARRSKSGYSTEWFENAKNGWRKGSTAGSAGRRGIVSRVCRYRPARGQGYGTIRHDASSAGHPRPVTRGTTSTAGLLARRSTLGPAFPVSQWRERASLAAYSCGGSSGLARRPETGSRRGTGFPLRPLREPLTAPNLPSSGRLVKSRRPTPCEQPNRSARHANREAGARHV